MLLKLTHPLDNYTLYIESEEIVAMERYEKPVTTLLTLDDKPDTTAIVLKSGRTLACKETPDEIISLMQ